MHTQQLGTRWPDLAPALPPALGAPRWSFHSAGSRLCLYLHPGPAAPSPLLLVHGLGMGSSAMEMRPVFEHFSGPDSARAVAALDLPGFGSSQRQLSPGAATPARMAHAIVDALAQLRARGWAQPVDVCALGGSCEFVAMAAVQASERFRSLAFISPDGLEDGVQEPCEECLTQGLTRLRPGLARLLSVAPLGELLFRSLSTRASLRQHFERLWDSPLIDEPLLDYSHQSARVPGARHMPLALLCGALSPRCPAAFYRRLALPVWLAHGTRGAFTDIGSLRDLGPASAWQVQAYDTGAMPHFEHEDLFCTQYGAFLRSLDQPGN